MVDYLEIAGIYLSIYTSRYRRVEEARSLQVDNYDMSSHKVNTYPK